LLTEDQAKAASRALLDQPQTEQQERAERLAAAKNRRSPPIKWLAIGALLGLVVGAALGYLFTGETSPWSIFGLSVGMAMGIGFDRRREA
jgi:F0F1-type ATP synthase assembly protein I